MDSKNKDRKGENRGEKRYLEKNVFRTSSRLTEASLCQIASPVTDNEKSCRAEMDGSGHKNT